MESINTEEIKNLNVTEQIAGLKKQFQAAVKEARKNRYPETLALSAAIVGQIINVVHQIGLDYAGAFMTHKTPYLADVKASIEKNRRQQSVKKENIFDLLFQIDTAINTLRREAKAVYGKSSSAGRWAWPLLTLILGLVLFTYAVVKKPEKQGLTGLYYANKSFRGPYVKRTDHTVNFNWKRRAPLRKFRSDHFSVRWAGFLQVPNNGLYELSVDVDDNANVWLGKTKVLSVQSRKRQSKDSILAVLKKGYYPVRIDYVERTRGARAMLSWRWSDWAKGKAVGPKYLVPSVEHLRNNVPVHDEKIKTLLIYKNESAKN